jgi:ATP-dependent Clp protease ATP-binding subunit ClpA
MARSGLGNAQKPIGSFLFSGPTGVGKTEVARQLAVIMGVELIRFDMSEYMERHAVSRLIGAPPGLRRLSTRAACSPRRSPSIPYSVLLLDEIEKAHPDIFNILLQVMDHGTLTDNNGRKADFRNVADHHDHQRGCRGPVAQLDRLHGRPPAPATRWAEIKRLFTPEFRNRLDAVISFGALDEQIILRVVDKFLMQLEAQLSEKKVDAGLHREPEEVPR